MFEHDPRIWITLFQPVATACVISFFFLKRPVVAAALSVLSVAVGFVCSVSLALDVLGTGGAITSELPWISVAGMDAPFTVTVDALTAVMLLVVTGIGGLIHVYATGYMKGDGSYGRFFACLSIFMFSMLGICLSAGFIQIFIFWELVGCSSYLLIGFWFEKPSAAEAAKKAFLTNRVGDFGMILGILLLFFAFPAGERTFSFAGLETLLSRHDPSVVVLGLSGDPLILTAGLLIFCGVMGKSAQFPLHTWLPDAMEGPTPVSALIHAATMVAAGVYLLARCFFLFEGSEQVMHIVAWVGGGTALMAALIATVQTDLKRILAYSTLSQLGYMVMAMGLGGRDVGMFHLTTHACFKALLFLCAGSVIHAVHTNDIFKMGGLLKRMPVTAWTFLVGTLALCGFFPFAGFWSKDEILALGSEHNVGLYYLGTATAMLTAYYMGRCFCVAFLGEPRDPESHAHESPRLMTVPLVILAVGSVTAGFLALTDGGFGGLLGMDTHPEFHMDIAVISNVLALGAFAYAVKMFSGEGAGAAAWARRLGPVRSLLVNKFYVDELYLWLVRWVQQSVAIVADLFDQFVIIRGIVGGLSDGTVGGGRRVKAAHTGRLRHVTALFALGAAGLVWWMTGNGGGGAA